LERLAKLDLTRNRIRRAIEAQASRAKRKSRKTLGKLCDRSDVIELSD
jgi:hypothetical protein